MEADGGGGGRVAWRDDTKDCALALPAATGEGTKGRSRPSREQVAARGHCWGVGGRGAQRPVVVSAAGGGGEAGQLMGAGEVEEMEGCRWRWMHARNKTRLNDRLSD
ncbi:hypothetical protein E2C01_023372 [Portunus trituberculatus]|uniref:Uncharacterized protein n=1 Tax=Portunus trituberculatus TaxID=210409 RepID=A0A5B7EAZ0_PORTR|nr:hypothetical protein [Portunus trituberculatus]